MILRGKYNTAKVFTHNIDEETKSQIINFCDQDFAKDSKIRIMPDTHAGVGCVIGFTANLGDKVIPNIVGVDIGCGLLVIELKKTSIDLKKLDNLINKYIPSGRGIQKSILYNFENLEKLHCYRELKNIDRIKRSIGTLGGGNHFIEINKDDEGNFYLVIHSGSRNLGNQVAQYYQRKAIELHKGKEKSYPRTLCYLEGKWREKYLNDMKICQEYATLNRQVMASIILDKMFGTSLEDYNNFETIHNYINFKDNIIRKGSISAYKGEKIIIPINMRDGSLLCIGKGNENWNYSAPHGAGRLMSRKKAKESITMEDYKNSMKDIYTTSVNLSTLDEAPMAYKPMEEIINNIGETAEVLKIIKPVYNFKAGE
ncbi:MAG: RtcB family protein [Tissierellia bacterium]|nr:RtcB family protein [Tissierellia bacterium]